MLMSTGLPIQATDRGTTQLRVRAAGSGTPSVVVVGGANLDVKARSAAPALLGTSNPGHASTAPGGVGRNVAENLARLGTPTHLVTAVGQDAAGAELLARTAAAGVVLDHVHRTEAPTGTYTALLDADGELLVAVADMSAVAELGPEHVSAARAVVEVAGLVVVDGNLAAATLDAALEAAAACGVSAVLDPVSVPKAVLVREHVSSGRPLYAVTPNRAELAALTGLPTDTDRELRTAADALHRRGVEQVWVRLGPDGSLLSSAAAGAVRVPAVATVVRDVTGAGDAGLAGFCHALLDGRDPVAAAAYGHAAAALTVASPHTVRPDLSSQLVEAELTRHEQERRT